MYTLSTSYIVDHYLILILPIYMKNTKTFAAINKINVFLRSEPRGLHHWMADVEIEVDSSVETSLFLESKLYSTSQLRPSTVASHVKGV